MKLLRYLIAVFTLATISSYVAATIDVYHFDDASKEARFQRLVQELRCPKCQNNNLADSNSLLAVDLKDLIYDQIQAGKDDEQIVSYLKARYGDFISYRPPLKPSTWLIWFGPFVVLAIGGFSIFRFVSKRQSTLSSTGSTSHLSKDSQAMLAQWSEEMSDDQYTSQEKEAQKGDNEKNEVRG